MKRYVDKGSQYRQPLLPSEHTGIAAVAAAAASILCSIRQNLWDMIHFLLNLKVPSLCHLTIKNEQKNRSIPVSL